MFVKDIARIIVDYSGLNIYNTKIIDLSWSNGIFLQMGIICLKQIINYLLSILLIKLIVVCLTISN